MAFFETIKRLQTWIEPVILLVSGWLTGCPAGQRDTGSRDVLVLALIPLASDDFTNYLPSSRQIKVHGGKCFSSQSSVLLHHHHHHTTTTTLTTTTIIPTTNTTPHTSTSQHCLVGAHISTIQGGKCTTVSIIYILEVMLCVFTQTLTSRYGI